MKNTQNGSYYLNKIKSENYIKNLKDDKINTSNQSRLVVGTIIMALSTIIMVVITIYFSNLNYKQTFKIFNTQFIQDTTAFGKQFRLAQEQFEESVEASKQNIKITEKAITYEENTKRTQIRNLLISEFSNILRYCDFEIQRIKYLTSDTSFIKKAGLNMLEYENMFYGQALMSFPYSFNKEILFSYNNIDYYQSFKNNYDLSREIVTVLYNLETLLPKINEYNSSLNSQNKFPDFESRMLFTEIKKLRIIILIILPQIKSYR